MPLKLAPQAPAQAVEVLRKALADLAGNPGGILQSLGAGVVDRFETSLPHPVYVLQLNDAAADRFVDASRLLSWRYLLVSGEKVSAAAEVKVNPQDGSTAFLQMDVGPFVEATVDAIATAEALHVVEKEDFEIRLLQIPALSLFVLWLHHPAGSLFIPFGRTPTEITPKKVYPMEEIQPIVAALARARKALGGDPDLDSSPIPAPTPSVTNEETSGSRDIKEGPSDNLDPERFPDLSWSTEALCKQSIEALYRFAEGSVQGTIAWYFREKGWRSFVGRLLRLLAILLTAFGTLVPILTSSNLSLLGQPAKDWGPFGYVALALAGACIALDRFFGFSSSWIRYVTTAMALRKLLAEFYVDWVVLKSSIGDAVSTASQREALLKRIGALLQQAATLVEKETAEWASEYRSSITELEKTAKEQLEAWKPGTIILAIANFRETNGNVQVFMNGRLYQTATEEVSRITPVFPGTHIVALESKLGDKLAGTSQDVTITSGQTVQLAFTLKVKAG